MRHGRAPGKHPQCGRDCPGHAASKATRPPTQEELRENIPNIRLCPKFKNDGYMAYLLEISVADLNRMYGPHASGSHPQSIGASMMEDADVVMGDNGVEERSELQDEDGTEEMADITGTAPELGHTLGHQYIRDQSTPGSTYSPLPEAPMVRSPEPEKAQTLRILYVPDPSRSRDSQQQTRADLGFTDRTILKSTFIILKDVLPDYIFPRRGGVHKLHPSEEERTRVRITEWVCGITLTDNYLTMTQKLWIMDRLSILKKDDRRYFDVSYMDWYQFKQIILSGGADELAHLLQYDCVLGGIDYTVDYR